MAGHAELSVSLGSVWTAPWGVGTGEADFRSCLLQENEMAEHTAQTESRGVRPGTPLGTVTNASHTFH